MKNKMLTTVVAAALVFAVLPAVASATPSLDLPPGGGHFTALGGAIILRNGIVTLDCASTTGTGDFTGPPEGTVQFLFHGCFASVLGTPFGSSGQPAGTVTTEVLPFHLMTAKGSGDPAVLITTAANGRFTTFSYLGVLVSITGNGIVGAITAPAYNTPSETFTFDFNATGASQEITETEESATKYTLEYSANGGAAVPGSEEFESVSTFTGGEAELIE